MDPIVVDLVNSALAAGKPVTVDYVTPVGTITGACQGISGRTVVSSGAVLYSISIINVLNSDTRLPASQTGITVSEATLEHAALKTTDAGFHLRLKYVKEHE